MPIVEENEELGDVNQLAKLIQRNEEEYAVSVDEIKEDHRFFHALTHPSVVKAFLKVYKES